MKTASFLFMSIALHAAALAYPALFVESGAMTPVVVTVIDSDGGRNGAGRKDTAEKQSAGPARKIAPATTTPQPERTVVQLDAAAEPARVAVAERLPAPAEPIALPVISPDVTGAIPIPTGKSEAVTLAENLSTAGASVPGSSASITPVSHEAGPGRGGIGTGAGEGSGTGRGSGRDGAGNGSGNGVGSGSGDGTGNGGGGVSFVKASYESCPRPETPEIARRQRLEGTVTLRVLVDEGGRPKSLQVHQSSGFPILDQAAIDNVKRRCRFYPARDGNKPVESWIRIPVIFPLADLKPR